MLQTGQTGETYVRQGDRTYVCLATLKNQALIEYEMSNGCTALRIIGPGGRRVAYDALPAKWLRALGATIWQGKPSRTGGRRIPQPADLLELRRGPQQLPLPLEVLIPCFEANGRKTAFRP